MNIVVTKHAIKRYRQRMFDYYTPNENIVKLLQNIVRYGKKVYFRPSSRGYCFEVTHKGISVVVIYETKGVTIITCLGDKTYRNWVKNKENKTCYNRLHYPENDNWVNEYMNMCKQGNQH
ncbi:Uncharacterized [Syntrophomonas zehnderi OL-4]|uniref:Uncharacterized n=1 Tax=Syntrophomonas zehnderi OL-4 TaxID=690567 RepID=A0A0E4GBJ6_9FIRM|nr:DUF4258 domain-containing protein [Syntrophomonas zehnderi]CFX46787.1 Uncharacterized [Syntrophomonas zehnderi OL-4]